MFTFIDVNDIHIITLDNIGSDKGAKRKKPWESELPNYNLFTWREYNMNNYVWIIKLIRLLNRSTLG